MKNFIAIVIFALLIDVAMAGDTVDVNAGSLSQSSGIGIGGPSSANLSFAPTSNYEAAKYRTLGGPNMPQLLQAAPNRFISNGKGMAENAQPVAGFLQKSCDTILVPQKAEIETLDDSYDKTNVVFAPYFDYLNGYIKDSTEQPMVSVSYDFFGDVRKMPINTRHLCMGVITVKSSENDLVPTQTLKLDAINFVRDNFGGTGPVLLVAEQSGLTSFEGVNSDGTAWGVGLNSAGNAGAPIIGASASLSGNVTDVDPNYKTGQTFYVLLEVKGDGFGHSIVADVIANAAEQERKISEQLAQAEINKKAALEAALIGGNGKNAIGSSGR